MSVSSNLPNIANPEYPGVLMSNGSRGPSVSIMQNYLNTIRSRFPSIPTLATDGAFGPITQNAVTAFQNLMRITANGIIGPITWNYIVSVRNAINMNTRAASASGRYEASSAGAHESNANSMLGLMLALSMHRGGRFF